MTNVELENSGNLPVEKRNDSATLNWLNRGFDLSKLDMAMLRGEQIHAIARVTPALMVANCFNSTVFAILCLNEMQSLWVLVWLASILSISAVTMLSWLRHRHKKPHRVREAAIHKLVLYSYMIAVPWSALPVFFLPAVGPDLRILVIALTAAMACGGALAMSRVPEAAITYAVTILGAAIFGFLRIGGTHYLALTSFTVMYLAVMAWVIASSYRMTLVSALERLKREEAQEANEAKSRFMAIVSHELRSPLNVIIGFADIIATRSGQRDLEENREFAEIISTSSRDLLNVVNDILDLSRFDEGGLRLQAETASANDLVAGVVRSQQVVAKNEGIDLEFVPLDPDVFIEVDVRRFRQVLINLTSNALKFTTANGVTRISCQLDANGALQIRISDNGPGVPDDARERIFQPFEQADVGRARRHNGTGLGLSIAKAITTSHGGTLSVDTDPELKGARFIVWLPASRLAEKRAA